MISFLCHLSIIYHVSADVVQLSHSLVQFAVFRYTLNIICIYIFMFLILFGDLEDYIILDNICTLQASNAIQLDLC